MSNNKLPNGLVVLSVVFALGLSLFVAETVFWKTVKAGVKSHSLPVDTAVVKVDTFFNMNGDMITIKRTNKAK